MREDFYAIIPAGGAGTRLWPISRRNFPKFLTDLTNSGQSMLQETVQRLAPQAAERIVIVTGAAHLPMVRQQLPQIAAENLLAEPSGRDSMAAIGLAAAILQRRHGEVIIGSFAADHHIEDTLAFQGALDSAIAAAAAGYVATIGITPDFPATGFGYIHAQKQLSIPAAQADFPVFAVAEFLEKPEKEIATNYFLSGEYKWNAGMFIARTSVLLAALQRFQPELAAGLNDLAAAWDTPNRAAAIADIWEKLPKIAIDHAIAEPLAKEGGVVTVPVEMGWSDVGDYKSLAEVLAKKAPAAAPGVPLQLPRNAKALVQTLAAPDALIYSAEKPVVVLGIEKAVVVECADVLFVTTQEQAQRVKEVVDNLPAALENLR